MIDRWTAGKKDGQTHRQANRWIDRPTDRQTNGQTKHLPILQDSVPCQGRCPASVLKNKERTHLKPKVVQGMGTAAQWDKFKNIWTKGLYLIKLACCQD